MENTLISNSAKNLAKQFIYNDNITDDLLNQFKLNYKNGQTDNEISFGLNFGKFCAKYFVESLVNSKEPTTINSDILSNFSKAVIQLNDSELSYSIVELKKGIIAEPKLSELTTRIYVENSKSHLGTVYSNSKLKECSLKGDVLLFLGLAINNHLLDHFKKDNTKENYYPKRIALISSLSGVNEFNKSLLNSPIQSQYKIKP